MVAPVTKQILEHATKLRKELHANPELSGKEHNTAKIIKSFVGQQNPTSFVERLGGNGIAAIYDSGVKGPSVLLRADLDALPIEETNQFAHRSTTPGVSHKCGHDGHMSILAGLSMILKTNRPKKGRVILLFQPEEENGQGAAKVIEDSRFSEIRPDFAFALHNLPGFKESTVVIKQGPFASASKGMIVHLHGRSSHAAHPEQGNSPVHMMIDLMNALMAIPKIQNQFTDFALLTIIHARLGEIAFGTNPGKAVVMSTLRTFLDRDMDTLNRKAVEAVETLQKSCSIDATVSYAEDFPATANNTEATAIVDQAVQMSGAMVKTIKEPFRWSEDFGHFTGMCKGAMFGLGAGEKHPSLHNHDYDFPDETLGTGIGMFYHIVDQLVTLQ